MVSIDATAQVHDGITLVTAVVEGGPVPTRVALANRLDGPVWPPRRMGEPVAGWTDEGYEGVVPADETVALGYACPATSDDGPDDGSDEGPLEVVATERASRNDTEEFGSPSAVLRGLGSPAPPRDAVPLPAPDSGDEPDEAGDAADPTASPAADPDSNPEAASAAVSRDRGQASPSRDDSAGALEPDSPSPPEQGPAPTPSEPGTSSTPSDDSPAPADASPPTAHTDLPEPVGAWLDRLTDRVERAEALADASDVPAATDAIRAVGSLDDVASLECRRSADAERLREVARRANALAYRAESAEIPLETLERLA